MPPVTVNVPGWASKTDARRQLRQLLPRALDGLAPARGAMMSTDVITIVPTSSVMLPPRCAASTSSVLIPSNLSPLVVGSVVPTPSRTEAASLDNDRINNSTGQRVSSSSVVGQLPRSEARPQSAQVQHYRHLLVWLNVIYNYLKENISELPCGITCHTRYN